MQRREFLSTFLSGVAGGLPFAAPADAPEGMHGAGDRDEQAMAARCERLSSQVEELSGKVQILGRELAEADQRRSQMLYLVHTMRSPLACIQIRTESMRDDAECEMSDRLFRDLDMSARSCELLAELINDVFALEKARRQAMA